MLMSSGWDFGVLRVRLGFWGWRGCWGWGFGLNMILGKGRAPPQQKSLRDFSPGRLGPKSIRLTDSLPCVSSIPRPVKRASARPNSAFFPVS
jgi:hypothetical protein